MVALGLCGDCQWGYHCLGQGDRSSSDPFSTFICRCRCRRAFGRILVFPGSIVRRLGLVLFTWFLRVGSKLEPVDLAAAPVNWASEWRRTVSEQIERGDPPEAAAAFRKLLAAGLDEAAAKDRIAALAAGVEMASVHRFDRRRYRAALRRLPDDGSRGAKI